MLCDENGLVWYENETEPIPALPGALQPLLAALLLAASAGSFGFHRVGRPG